MLFKARDTRKFQKLFFLYEKGFTRLIINGCLVQDGKLDLDDFLFLGLTFCSRETKCDKIELNYLAKNWPCKVSA